MSRGAYTRPLSSLQTSRAESGTPDMRCPGIPSLPRPERRSIASFSPFSSRSAAGAGEYGATPNIHPTPRQSFAAAQLPIPPEPLSASWSEQAEVQSEVA